MEAPRGDLAAGRTNSEFGGVDLYRRNAFRVVGLFATDDRRAVWQRQEQIAAALATGSAVPVWFEIPRFAPPPPPTADQALSAVEQLADPARRVVHELFWLWGEQDMTCGCPVQVHTEHDRAVVAHMTALELERSAEAEEPHARTVFDTVWVEAAQMWAQLLDRPELREHIDYRARLLNVPGWDGIRSDASLAELPRALVEPLVQLAMTSDGPERLVGLARRWRIGEPLINDLLAAGAAQVLGRLNTSLDRMMDATDSNEVYGQVEPIMLDLLRHEALIPGSTQVVSLRNQAAHCLTDCAATQLSTAGASREAIEKWFEVARRLAGDPETRARLAEDQRSVFRAVRRSSLLSWIRRRVEPGP